MAIEFESVLQQAEGMSATGIPVPSDVVQTLGAKNARVTASVRRAGTGGDWFTYSMSIGSRGGQYLLSFSSANRAASGLNAGDPLDVSVELDTHPRTIEIPDDLRAALESAGLLEKFTALSYSQQRAQIDPILAAKAAETRDRRIAKTLGVLAG